MYNIAYKQNCTNALLTNVHTKFAGLPLLPKYIRPNTVDLHENVSMTLIKMKRYIFYKMKYEFHFIFPDSLCK